MFPNPLDEELRDLGSAEEFLEYFGIIYDRKVVQVNRVHILRRFHDYLECGGEDLPDAMETRREVYLYLLRQAYQDFVELDSRSEKVFAGFTQVRTDRLIPLQEIGLRKKSGSVCRSGTGSFGGQESALDAQDRLLDKEDFARQTGPTGGLP